jgi:hypothetical protein
MVHKFFNVVSIFKFIKYFYQQYIANMIGAACNFRIPQANKRAQVCTCKEFKPLE